MTDSLSEQTPNLGLPYLWPAQAQKHVTHNEALQRLDALSQIVLLGMDETTPPAAPELGGLWAVGLSALGAWEGEDSKLALWDGTGWQFMNPKAGWIAWDVTDARLCRHDGTDWQVYTPAHLQGLGIGTAPDDENRLAVRAPATLLTHEGAGHQLKINKAASAETASLLFQTDWQGHAEIGLTGHDDLTIKVSADGTTWQPALKIAAATGAVTLTGPVSGGAVTQTPQDQTEGRLLKTGDGGVLGPVAHDGMNLDAAPFGFWGNGLAGNPPVNAPGVGDGLWAGWHVGNAAAALQFAGRCDGASGLFVRARVDDDWADWRGLYDQHTVIGTVAFSAGRNTGAVVESGTSGTAHYLRLACGTQICWGTVDVTAHAVTQSKGVLYGSNSATTFTFAKDFIALPQVSVGMVTATGHPAMWPASVSPTTSGTSVQMLSATAVTPATLTISYQAMGRWRA